MRCQYGWIIALFAAIPLAAMAEDLFPPDAGTVEKSVRIKDLADRTAAPASEAKSEASRPSVPTPAKRKLIASRPTQPESPQDAPPVETTPAADPLQPIPNALEAGPVRVEAASFKGVVPGTSTRSDVEKIWGRPKDATRSDGELVQWYSIEPFRQVEVHYAGQRVVSVLIRLDRAFPADAVAKQLDLLTVRPVLVSNELGEALGMAYPERGVLFAFEPSEEPGKASMKVMQIVLEPISAEAFVLRAQTTLDNHCELARLDAEQAIELEPDNARAHWLRSRALAAMEQYEQAVGAADEAVRLDPETANYRLTRAQMLAQVGRFAQALEDARRAMEASQKQPHVRAKALCLMGDLAASGAEPDYRKALSFHTQAVQAADPLSSRPHPAVRVAAKEALMDAHLGAAHDIAWGDWKEKGKAVSHWLQRAFEVSDDLVQNEGGSREQAFRAHVRAMAALVGVRGEIDPEATVKEIVHKGEAAIASVRNPARRARIQWDLGLALYDALQIYQLRADFDRAMQCGDKAVQYMTQAVEVGQTTSASIMLGRLYFRLGTIHATRDANHRAAVGWFDKAVPLLEQAPAEELNAQIGRHGESLVAMGVSYWETGQRKKAVALTEKGIQWMERAVRQDAMPRSALSVPYGNLAAMHRKLGDDDKADRYQELAGRAKKETVR